MESKDTSELLEAIADGDKEEVKRRLATVVRRKTREWIEEQIREG